MSCDFSIRIAEREDATAVVRFNQLMAQGMINKSLAVDVISEGVENLLTNPDLGFFVVAEHKGKIVGSMMVNPQWSNWRNASFWWIQSTYVLPDYRRQGVCRSLYQFVKSRAEHDDRVCGLRLSVSSGNISARETYKALGMTETDYVVCEEVKAGLEYFDKSV